MLPLSIVSLVDPAPDTRVDDLPSAGPVAASESLGCQAEAMAAVQGSMIVITGPPGAGKSTVARIVADSFETSVLLMGDDFHHFIRQGYVSPWLAQSEPQNEVVIDTTAEAAVAYALGGYSVVVDGIIGPWFVERWLVHVPENLPVHYVILCPSRDVALSAQQKEQAKRT